MVTPPGCQELDSPFRNMCFPSTLVVYERRDSFRQLYGLFLDKEHVAPLGKKMGNGMEVCVILYRKADLLANSVYHVARLNG